MVSKELCEVHEAFQHLKKKWVEQQIVEPVKYSWILLRFAENYGENSPKLTEEDQKVFDTWMEQWLEKRNNDFLSNYGTATWTSAAYKTWSKCWRKAEKFLGLNKTRYVVAQHKL